MRFCPNLSMLFKEVDFVERFARAADAGFAGVEFWWPSGEDLDQVKAAIKDSGLEVALFNFDAGDMPNGDRGLASDPDRNSSSATTSRSPSSWPAPWDAHGSTRWSVSSSTAWTATTSWRWRPTTWGGPPTRPPSMASR